MSALGYRRTCAVAAAVVAPQGHAISVALRTLVARRSLVLRVGTVR